MRDGNNILQVEALDGVDMIGFIFYPKSPRYVSTLPSYLPAHAKRVGVFVNADKQEVLTCADRFGLDYIQLHGTESPDYCRSLQALGMHLIKAFHISQASDLDITQAYEGVCSFYVFDTKTSVYGGSGQQFDWNVLNSYTGHTPFLLSGGISPFSARALLEFDHRMLAGYDLNSRFETSVGIKNPELIRLLLDGIMYNDF